MGNAAAGPGGGDRTSDSSEEDEEGGNASSADRLQQLAKRYKVSHIEVLLLYERFQMLGPDEDGFVNRSVFQKPPYSTNPFSRQVNVLSWFIF